MPTAVLARSESPDDKKRKRSRSRTQRVSLLAIVIAVLLIAAALVSGHSSNDKVSTDGKATNTSRARAGTGAGDGASSRPGTNGDGGVSATTVARGASATSANIPLDVSASDTSHLHDGDPVTVHVTPQSGSQIFGFEAFLCEGGETYQFDADVRPTLTGKCVSKPLSSSSNDYQEVRASPPFSSVDTVFHVGAGADSYQTRDGRTVTITCDAAHPCDLVLKLQFPDGFGFQAIPLTFE